MATVVYNGTTPVIAMSRDLMDDIKHLFKLSPKKVGLFLVGKFDGKRYNIVDWYLPEQAATTYGTGTSINAEELLALGEPFGEDDEVLVGVCVGGGETKADMTATDKTFFSNVTKGLNSYIRMNMGPSATYRADIIAGEITFEDVRVVVMVPPCSPEREGQLKAKLAEKVHIVTTYQTQEPRQKVIPSVLLQENRDWRGVV